MSNRPKKYKPSSKPRKIRTLSEEHKRRIGLSNAGKALSLERIEKIKIALKKNLSDLSPEEVQKKLDRRIYFLKNKYKLSLEEYTKLLDSQDGKCFLCGIFPGRKPLNVDHDHRCCSGDITCGKCIRGLLCDVCNHAISRIEKDSSWALKALEYTNSKRQ